MTVGALRTPLALLVELLWAYAAVALFVELFGQDDGPAPSFALVALVVAGAFMLARLLQASDFEEETIRAIGVGVVVAAFLLALRIEYATDAWPWEFGWLNGLLSDPGGAASANANAVAGVVALIPLWLRGIVRGQESDIEFDDLLSSASAGLLVVLVAAIAQPDTREPSSWGAYAFAYGVVALVTLAVFRSPEPEAPLWRFVARWSWGLAAVGGLAFATALFAAALDPETFGFLEPVSEPLRTLGGWIGDYIFAPIFWVISLPFVALRELFEMTFDEREPQERPPPTEEPETDEGDEDTPVWVRALWALLLGAGLLLFTSIVLVALWTAFKRFAKRQQQTANVRYDSIEPESSLRDDLSGMLGALARRFRRDPRTANSIAVRRLYAEMLADAAAAGIERAPSLSPAAFAPALERHYTSRVPAEISEAFVESRYAEREIDSDRVRALSDRWRQLRSAHPAP